MAVVSSARYRCAACGNLTRFDVTTTRRTRAYHHFSLSGDLSVEDPEVLSEIIESVSCRWCGSGRAVEPLADAALPAVDGEPGPERPSEREPGPPAEQPEG
ncbi:MAG: hypothetical protein ACR2LJ_04565 [Acidimicrobiales bacterium]